MPEADHIAPQSFRDSIATIDDKGKRSWIYPKQPKGRLYKLRSYLSYVYLLLFFGLPFIKVSGEPLFMLNILERKFILFLFENFVLTNLLNYSIYIYLRYI